MQPVFVHFFNTPLSLIQLLSFVLHLLLYDPHTTQTFLCLQNLTGLLVSSLTRGQPPPSPLKGAAEMRVQSSHTMRGFKDGKTWERYIWTQNFNYSDETAASFHVPMFSAANRLVRVSSVRDGRRGKAMGGRNTLSFWHKHFGSMWFCCCCCSKIHTCPYQEDYEDWLFLSITIKIPHLPEKPYIIPSSDLIYAILLELQKSLCLYAVEDWPHRSHRGSEKQEFHKTNDTKNICTSNSVTSNIFF